MKLDGFDDFKKKLEKLQETPEEAERFMKLQGEALKADVKVLKKKGGNHPYKTGTLRNAWQRKSEKSKGEYRELIYNATSYASHVEYGHRHWKNKKVFVKGFFMLRKAVDKRKLRFYKDLSAFLKEMIEK